ncbi:MAG: DNA primase [Alphaproteobacteria bacterium]|jgi:DNA primase|nr:DNA primase [Alphaproteobacteria bacterium]MDP6517818.1 DNA primase [Alphaproteobacteria bacterium]
MAFPLQFLDEIRFRLPLGQQIGRRVRLARKGREFYGLCPFHKEKTPSFSVNEDKGFFHCFGCGAHGDVFGFTMRIDGLSFPEAVERLAGECGVPMPARTPESVARDKQAADLHELCEAAANWFADRLHGTDGAAARDYLRGRGLDEALIRHFRLGYAPDSRYGLKSHLIGAGADEDALIRIGLIRMPDDARPAYDFFRGRVIFPIADRRGRVIAFGGRGLGDGQPKYLNSADSDLFSKGRELYNFAGARKAVHGAGSVIVAEGYMDVIALHRAGLENAVAPLGTAVTEDQLGLLWQVCAEPVICLDGDAAGRRAAARAAERALPLLKPGRSLRFAVLPAGEDPDSLVAADAVEVLETALSNTRALVDFVWELEIEREPTDTPERRAGFRKRLDRTIAQIGDRKVRDQYYDELSGRFRDAFRRPTRGRGRDRNRDQRLRSRAVRNRSLAGRALGSDKSGDPKQRESVLVAAVVNHPDLLATVEEEFAMVALATAGLDRLRHEILDIYVNHPQIDCTTLRAALASAGLANELALVAGSGAYGGALIQGFARPEAGLAEAERGWRETLALHRESVEPSPAPAEALE